MSDDNLSATMASSLTTEMTDDERRELGLVGSGTGNDVSRNAHSESQTPACTGEALENIPAVSMADFMTGWTNVDILMGNSILSGNELAASKDSLRFVQCDGSVITSHTIANGNSAPGEDDQPTRLSGFLPQEDPATLKQWQNMWNSDPVRRQNTPIPTPTPLERVDDLPSVYLSNLRLGPPTEAQRAAYALFFDNSSEYKAGSTAPGEETTASNQANRLAPAPRRNPRDARRGSGRRSSLRRTTEAEQV